MEQYDPLDTNPQDTKSNLFRDPVYGYIAIDKVYVRWLIDTEWVQRLKQVAQTGMAPLFVSATHNRFAHTLGVYQFANKLYRSLQKELIAQCDAFKDKMGKKRHKELIEYYLTESYYETPEKFPKLS